MVRDRIMVRKWIVNSVERGNNVQREDSGERKDNGDKGVNGEKEGTVVKRVWG